MEYKASMMSPLLITNAVFAAAKVDTLLTNPSDRAALAKSAILKIIESRNFDKIVVVDGSNHLLLTDRDCWLASRAGVEIEQIAFQQDSEKVILCGKGHGEMQIVEFAVRNSILLKAHPSFYKLSGRYFLKNASQVLRFAERHSNLFFNYNPGFCLPESQFTCSAFYKCSLALYENSLRHAIDYCAVERAGRLESAFFKVLSRGKRTHTVAPFPRFEGVGGTMGVPIKNRFALTRNVYSLLGGLAFTVSDVGSQAP